MYKAKAYSVRSATSPLASTTVACSATTELPGISFVVCGFQLAVGAGVSIRLVVKEAIGQGAAKLLVEQDERKGDFGALAGEPVGIAFAIPLNQS